MNTSFVYFFGFLLVVAGLAYGATMLGVPPIWVGVGAVVLVGLGIMSTVTSTKTREPAGDAEVTRTTTVRRD